jgi:hypothetical protein
MMKNKLPLKRSKTKIEEQLEKAIRERGLGDKDSKKIYIDPRKKDKK